MSNGLDHAFHREIYYTMINNYFVEIMAMTHTHIL